MTMSASSEANVGTASIALGIAPSIHSIRGNSAETASVASERKGYLDGWRGLAILLVLESHFLHVLPLNTGRLGVDVFFCLSGFLMSGILFVQKQPLSQFYKRRISRIAPVFVTFVVAIYAFAYFKSIAFTQAEFVASLFFLRTYFPQEPWIWGSGVSIGHLWSLNIEEHCYIFMSLLVLFRLSKKREGLVLFLTGVLCLLLTVLYVKLQKAAPSWTFLGTEIGASHLLVAAAYRLMADRVRPLVPGWLPVLILVLTLVCYSSLVPWWYSRFFTPFLLAFTVNHLSESSGWFQRLLSNGMLKWFGVLSFSIYLWQQPFYNHKASFPGGVAVAFLCAVATGVLSFYVLEKPSRTLLNKIM